MATMDVTNPDTSELVCLSTRQPLPRSRAQIGLAEASPSGWRRVAISTPNAEVTMVNPANRLLLGDRGFTAIGSPGLLELGGDQGLQFRDRPRGREIRALDGMALSRV
jgi:hypothetical protein